LLPLEPLLRELLLEQLPLEQLLLEQLLEHELLPDEKLLLKLLPLEPLLQEQQAGGLHLGGDRDVDPRRPPAAEHSPAAARSVRPPAVARRQTALGMRRRGRERKDDENCQERREAH
jgi:hypothetical protein